jgi:enamine deaminase RidA (YjgF/YER057c/UK114 family)
MWTGARTRANGKKMNLKNTAEARIRSLGIEIPEVPRPLGAYVEAVQSGNLLFLTGAMPIVSGKPKFAGKLGTSLTAHDGFEAAKLAATNALAMARDHLGTLDRVTRVLKTEIYAVATDEIVSELPRIADGASELLRDIFGADKLSVRKVIGVANLPLNVPIMVEIVLEVSD